MQKGERIVWGLFMAAALLALLGLLYSITPVGAQDNEGGSIAACYQRTDAGVVFIFSNLPEKWFSYGGIGWYYIGEDVQVEEQTLIVKGLQFDNGYAYAIVGAGDYSLNDTQSTDTALECALPPPTPTTIPTLQPDVILVAAVQSTGVMCVIKYPQIILVCSR